MSGKTLSIVLLVVLLGASSLLIPIAYADSDGASVVETAVPLAQDEPTTEGESSENSLPEGLSRIFAALGLYIVTMFTMAIGTEIVVDIVKLVLGLKSKPTAKKVLDDYEKMLPGTLDSLGVATQAQHNLQNQVAALREILRPAFKAEEVIVDIQTGEFTDALNKVAGEDVGATLIAKAAGVAKDKLKTAVSHINNHSALGQQINSKWIDELNRTIDDIASQAAADDPDAFFRKAIAAVNGKLADNITEWASEQIELLQNVTYETARRTVETQLLPQLESSGLSEKTESQIKLQIDDFLDNLKKTRQADIYLQSLNDILQDVEKQRDELRNRVIKWYESLTHWLHERISWLPHYNNKLDTYIADPSKAAGKLLEIERRDKSESGRRIQLLRLVSVIIGIYLAYFLHIDSADLLSDLIPSADQFLSFRLLATDSPLISWMGSIFDSPLHDLTGGIVLTGLAASAGSGFWHDQLSRLQNVKKTTEAAYAAIQPVITQVQSSSDQK